MNSFQHLTLNRKHRLRETTSKSQLLLNELKSPSFIWWGENPFFAFLFFPKKLFCFSTCISDSSIFNKAIYYLSQKAERNLDCAT